MKDITYEPLERCVMCGALTAIPESAPVEERQYYEAGCGQLCSDCYRKLNGGTQDEKASDQR